MGGMYMILLLYIKRLIYNLYIYASHALFYLGYHGRMPHYFLCLQMYEFGNK